MQGIPGTGCNLFYDEVVIPAVVKHWQGAEPENWVAHLAVEVPGEKTRNEWCKPVADEEYKKLK